MQLAGVGTVDEARSELGLDPLEGDVGDMTLQEFETTFADDGTRGDVDETEAAWVAHAPPEMNKVGERPAFPLEADLDDPLSPEEQRIDAMQFDSSNLKAGLYDKQTQDLYIRFIGDPLDRLYVYLDVEEEVWQALKDATSHGSYHYHNIRMDYPYEEITNTTGWPQIGAAAPTPAD